MADPKSLFRAWDVFLMRAPLAEGEPGLSGIGDHRELLRTAAADPVLSEAIAVATPSLSGLLRRVAEGRTDGVKPTQLRRAALAVLRYDIRMRTRPTPFGLFSGVTGGHFDATAKLRRGATHRTRTHVDMQWLLRVVHQLETDRELLTGLRVRAHPALRVKGDRLVLDCPSTLGELPSESARANVSVRDSVVVRAVWRYAERTIPMRELIDRITGEFRASADQVEGLLWTLLTEEILLTNLRPPLDGRDALRYVIGVLVGLPRLSPAAASVLAGLRRFDELRMAYDQLPPGEGQSVLTELMSNARQLNAHPTPLHVDTALDVEVVLPYEVRTEAEQAMELMWRMSGAQLGLFGLRDYHARFLERYGTDRLIGILDLLDEAQGLGAPAGYVWPPSEAVPNEPPSRSEAARNRVLHRLVARAVKDRGREVVLTDEILAALLPEDHTDSAVPNSCELTLQVVATSLDALSSGEFRFGLSPLPGSHLAGATFGRFVDLVPAVQDRLRAELTRLPVHVDGSVHVDIAFLPKSGKAANLVNTPLLTNRRVNIGLSDSEHLNEVRLADIAVGATLDRLFAVHVPTGQEIIPVLGSMISPAAQAPNAARLLWEIGLEGQKLWRPWNWGLLADSPYVPRVRRGRFVLAPAIWRLDELREAPEAEFGAAVARWRADWSVPGRVLVVSNDQRLLLDLDDPLHLELLHHELHKEPSLYAQESPGDFVSGVETIGHLAEYVIPMSRRDVTAMRSPQAAYSDENRAVSSLGGDWLYLTLYGPAHGQDELLRTRFAELVGTAREHGVDRWFFIRYTDARGHHLRVRLHGPPDALWSGAVRAIGDLLARWQKAGLIGEHLLGQYDPEVERYGGVAALIDAERVFEADSETAIRLLQLEQAEQTLSRDGLAAISVAALAASFGVPAPEPGYPDGPEDDAALGWLSRTGTRRALPRSYRREAWKWRSLIDPYDDWTGLRAEPIGDEVLAALAARKIAVGRLRAAVDGSRTRHGRLVGSLIHMTCNRLLGGNSARETEVVAIARGAVQDNASRRSHQ